MRTFPYFEIEKNYAYIFCPQGRFGEIGSIGESGPPGLIVIYTLYLVSTSSLTLFLPLTQGPDGQVGEDGPAGSPGPTVSP